MAAAPLECSVDMGLFLDGEFTDIMAAYLIKCHTHELTAILDDENTSTSRHHSVAVDCLSLLEFHLILGTLALHHPLRLQPLLDTGVREAQQQVLDALKEKDPFNPAISFMTVKESCHVRMHSLPKCPEMCKPTVTSIRASDINRLISVSGTVIRTGSMKMIHQRRECERSRLVRIRPRTLSDRTKLIVNARRMPLARRSMRQVRPPLPHRVRL